MTRILAIDTVSQMCSVALQSEERTFYREQRAPQQHTALVLDMIQSVLDEARLEFVKLDAIAFSRGPGSFTGLRICAGVAQGLALAHNLPVLPVSSLAILAQGGWRETQQPQILACMDARKNEVYVACFKHQDGIMCLSGEEQVIAPSQVCTPGSGSWLGIGNGFSSYAHELRENRQVNVNKVISNAEPLARDMLPLALAMYKQDLTVAAGLALPVYLRDNVAQPSGATQGK